MTLRQRPWLMAEFVLFLAFGCWVSGLVGWVSHQLAMRGASPGSPMLGLASYRVGIEGQPIPGLDDNTSGLTFSPATGTLDPLMLYAVVFRAHGNTAALVSADLGRPPMRDVQAEIHKRAASLGVLHVFFAATHTHHAPEMDVPDAPHANAVMDAAVEAIAEALGLSLIHISEPTRPY